MQVLFVKSQNPGYTRKDGVHVDPFSDKRVVKVVQAKWSATGGTITAPQYGLPCIFTLVSIFATDYRLMW